ncbi:glycosyltransferase family 2 protein [Actibacterium ureilyticum]|uniref:glycosyltransferase family 2 protein n=1 Tax=Actibacterium ureilyticum TaxID=1590614 RepID=UPI000BAB1894|nr:glycosyltransferase family 2 protein [Actibacterium ureilyticum]
MPTASIIVPAFNVERTLADTLSALQAQTFDDFEVIIVNDGSSDRTLEIAAGFVKDGNIRVVTQPNRGLAGARNTGIAAARGDFIGFCDADDLWLPGKLAAHIRHLRENPAVGISFSGSDFINDDGCLTGQAQRPRLTGIDAAHVFKRNPVGNGSAAVLRRDVLDEIAFRPPEEDGRDWYFDERFRQSEDIECWLRIALTTRWRFEGIPGLLTQYRINAGGLSSATDRQFAAWERMVEKLAPLAPDFFRTHTQAARAYQLRFLSRRAVADLDGAHARKLSKEWLACSYRPLWEEPLKSAVTLAAAHVLWLCGEKPVLGMMTLVSSRRQNARVAS